MELLRSQVHEARSFVRPSRRRHTAEVAFRIVANVSQ